MLQTVQAVLPAVLLAGCASNVYVPYPDPAESDETSRIIVKLSEPMRAVTVEIDGVLVTEDAHTERVEIEGVPAGQRVVRVLASEESREAPIDQTEVVTVEPNEPATVLVPVPGHTTGYWILLAAVTLLYLGGVQ